MPAEVHRDSASRRYGPALEKTYGFLFSLIPTLERFPPSQRLLLGNRIESAALDMLEGLIEATYTRDRIQLLNRVNLRIEKLRFLTRLSMDLHYLDPRRYEHAVRALDEIGRLVGAWRKGNDAEAP